VLGCPLFDNFDIFIETEVLEVRTPPSIVVEDTGAEVSVEINCDLFFVCALFITGTLNQSLKSASKIIKINPTKFGRWGIVPRQL
jgi:hypothetical protein